MGGTAGWHGGWLQEAHVQVKDPPVGHGVRAPDSQTISLVPLCSSHRLGVGCPGCNTNQFQAPLKYAEMTNPWLCRMDLCFSWMIGREMKGTVISTWSLDTPMTSHGAAVLASWLFGSIGKRQLGVGCFSPCF